MHGLKTLDGGSEIVPKQLPNGRVVAQMDIRPDQYARYANIIYNWNNHRHRGNDLPDLLIGLMSIGRFDRHKTPLRSAIPKNGPAKTDPISKLLIGESIPDAVKLDFYIRILKSEVGIDFGIHISASDDFFSNNPDSKINRLIAKEMEKPHNDGTKQKNEVVWSFVNREVKEIQHRFDTEYNKFLEKRKNLSAYPNSLPPASEDEKIQQRNIIAGSHMSELMRVVARAYELCK